MTGGVTVAWELAWRAVERFREQPSKVEGIPRAWESAEVAERRRAQRLFYAWLRWSLAVEQVMEPWMQRSPRLRLQSLLQLAACEVVTAPADTRPAVVHYAAGIARKRLSAGEAGMVNAVLRRFVRHLEQGALPPEIAHPDWLVQRWRDAFGNEAAGTLCAWNQSEPPIYACWEGLGLPPQNWQRTQWEGYFNVAAANWEELRPLLDARKAYIQDPFARHPVELIAPGEGEAVLDGCAAPGGKSRGLLRSWQGDRGHLVSVDLPGGRFDRLRENLSDSPGALRVSLFEADLTQLDASTLRSAGLPDAFDGILIDAPCSNTGVIARRPDVRHHLEPAQIEGITRVELDILRGVAPLVREQGGRLVYSTCSLEREENEMVVEAFLAEHPEFVLKETRFSRPWIDGHDGGAAFLLVRRSAIV